MAPASLLATATAAAIANAPLKQKQRTPFTRDLGDASRRFAVRTRQPRYQRFDRGSHGKYKAHAPA